MKNFFVYACVAASFSGGPFSPLSPELPLDSTFQLTRFPYPDADTVTAFPASIAKPAPAPLEQAHAHNDYEHERPLLDALAHGFNFIEVDVWLIENELYVSHHFPVFLQKANTLKNLYLDPLDKLIGENDGRVFTESAVPLHLMIDIKTGAIETYQVLKHQLEPFRHWITHFCNDKTTERAVRIFLSGNRPIETLASENERFMALDGRIEDLGKDYPPSLMPVISEPFQSIFGWQLPGMKRLEKQWQVFERITRLVHAEGKKVRLWASPEDEVVWKKLLLHGADLINTDELTRLHRFLIKRKLAMPAPSTASLAN
jgi:hypothetical protein